MNDSAKDTQMRSRIVTGSVLIAIAVALIVFRSSLVAWFAGKPMAGAGGSTTVVQSGALALEASLTPDPPRTSGNALILAIKDSAGHAVQGAQVDVQYSMPAMGAMAEMKGRAKVAPGSAGGYRAEFDLPMAGSWTLKVNASTSAASVSQDFALTVGTSGLRAIDSSGSPASEGVVTIPAARRQLIGVRTSPVVEADMVLSVRAMGRLAYDESKMSDVSLKVRGWIVKLLVSNTGQHVNKGQTLFTIYSPELYAAQQDFLLATRGQSVAGGTAPGRGNALAQAARQRLRLLDMADAQIDELAQRGQPLENIPFVARAAGYVIEKDVVEGASVEPGMRLYRIAALDKVWIEADVYEADFTRVRAGQKASVTLDYVPGRVYAARVAYVYPYLNPDARTGRVRIELVNNKLELRPGMYANVELESDLGPRLQVPSSAVVYTGPRRIVFVDLGEGRFRAQEVQIGAEAGDMYEVLSGLKAGDAVATSGVFLIAAEARISTAATYWDSTQAGEIGAAQPRMAPLPSAQPVARPPHAPTASPATTPGNTQAPVYTCPMHPEVRSATPGQCPKCGMDLVPEKTR